MNKYLKKFLDKQVIQNLVTRAEKKPEKEAGKAPEGAEKKMPDKKLIGAGVAVGVGAFLALCTVKSLRALKQARKEKAEREQEAPAEEAPKEEEAPAEEAPVEEAPAEEQPAEEAPVEEAPAEA